MNPAIIIIALLFFTALIMMVAMGLAWLHFGRQRHVLSWTISYAESLFQWIANVGGVLLNNGVLMAIAGIFIVISGTLVLVGVRQRSARPVPWRLLIGAGTLVALGGSYAALIGDHALQGIIVPGYIGLIMAGSALSLWPRHGRFSAPETAFFVMLLLFALFQAGLTSTASLQFSDSARGLMLYRALLGLGLPSIYVGTGVAAILVVAGDLAHQLRRQMRHDPLTNVLNRRGLEEAAARAIANAQRHNRPLALVVCDLDGFKALNDSHGHVAGDAALRGFADLLASATRQGDIVARLGGDEFGLMLIETGAHAAAEVMERVRAEVTCLILPQAGNIAMQASFGVTELRANDDILEHLFLRADAALYAAKNDGKNRVAIWRAAA